MKPLSELDGLRQLMRNELQREDIRHVYADTYLNAFVAAQIKTLREDRGLSQAKLAEMIGTKQSGISRLENAGHSAWKTDTLRKLAHAFGVRLHISFEEFGTLWREVARFNRGSLGRRAFEYDSEFALIGSLGDSIVSGGSESDTGSIAHATAATIPRKLPKRELVALTSGGEMENSTNAGQH